MEKTYTEKEYREVIRRHNGACLKIIEFEKQVQVLKDTNSRECFGWKAIAFSLGVVLAILILS